MQKDPVCGMKLDDNNVQSTSQYKGQTYSFCSEDCRRQFEKAPEQYAEKQTAA